MRARAMVVLALLLPASITAVAADDILPWQTDSTEQKPAPAARKQPPAAPAKAPEPKPADAKSNAAAAAAAPAQPSGAKATAATTGADAKPAASKQAPAAPAAAAAATIETSAAPAAPKPAAGAAPDAAKTAAKAPDPVPAKKLFGAAKVAARMTPKAIGTYAKGCLAGGEALPTDGPAWQAMRLSRNRNWAHPVLVAMLERFATEMKDKESWPGLLIGDLSQPRGGPMLTGHKSHQVGLDADIWFKPMPSRTLSKPERETFEPLLLAKDNGSEVIKENWNDGFARLVKRVADYPEVERIFVHPAIKKKFCEVSGPDKAWLAKVRPMWLHNYHFHVRISCPAGSGSCEKQKATTGEDGCGKEVDDWIKLVSRPAKPVTPAPKPTVPVKPPPPAPVLTLEKLPPECRQVLAAAPDGIAPPPPVAIAHKPAAPPPAKPQQKKTAEQ